MRYLLDTHTFIWWVNEPEKLSSRALSLCEDENNELTLSVASIWEIQIKMQLGKISFRAPLANVVSQQQQSNGINLLSVQAAHVFEINHLPQIHKDPFDRLLVAQARTEGFSIISQDMVIKQYAVEVEW